MVAVRVCFAGRMAPYDFVRCRIGLICIILKEQTHATFT